MKIDNRAIAFANESVILAALHATGYLRIIDIAKLAWPASSEASSLRMAQRTVARMVRDSLLLQNKAPNGANLVALSSAGAKRTSNELHVEAKSGKDYFKSLANFGHRCMANEAWIQARLAGFPEAYSEHQIYAERAPIYKWVKKMPDLLIFGSARYGRGFWWVEVEHSLRNTAEWEVLFDWMKDAIHTQYVQKVEERLCGENLVLLGVVFLFQTQEELNRFLARIYKELKSLFPAPEGEPDDFITDGYRFNAVSNFIQDTLYFSLLDDFGAWLQYHAADAANHSEERRVIRWHDPFKF